jgi:hypothetical protein
MAAPQFTADDRPADILDRTGRRLADELGCRWVRSRRTAESANESLTLQLILQSSTWSRSGLATWVRPRIGVLDRDLRAWRLARPDETVFPGSRVAPFVCNTMLGRVEPDLGSVEFSGLPRQTSVPSMIGPDEFTVRFRELVAPVLGLFGSSSSLAVHLPDRWLVAVDSGMIEQALARNDRESAALLIRRYMDRPLQGDETWSARMGIFRAGWENAPGAGQHAQHGAGALGRLARIHDLPGPASLVEPRQGSSTGSPTPPLTTGRV